MCHVGTGRRLVRVLVTPPSSRVTAGYRETKRASQALITQLLHGTCCPQHVSTQVRPSRLAAVPPLRRVRDGCPLPPPVHTFLYPSLNALQSAPRSSAFVTYPNWCTKETICTGGVCACHWSISDPTLLLDSIVFPADVISPQSATVFSSLPASDFILSFHSFPRSIYLIASLPTLLQPKPHLHRNVRTPQPNSCLTATHPKPL